VRRLRLAGVNEVAIERGDGQVVDTLLETGLTVVVINPNQAHNRRGRYGSAGNAVCDFAADSRHVNP
jgi:hypothetical protein